MEKGAEIALVRGRPIANESGLPGFSSFLAEKIEFSGCPVAIHLLVPDLLVALPKPFKEAGVVFRT